MRAPLTISLLLAFLVFGGCSQSGDFSGFFIGEVTKYGGHPKAGVTASRLDARWMIQSDDDGFRIFVRGQPFSAVDGMMQQIFGDPKVSAVKDSRGYLHSVYGSPAIGMAIQCLARADDVEIICVKGTSIPFDGGSR
jgi:hypothetical protein